MLNLNHIIKYALTLSDEQAARKLVARAINVADEIRLFAKPNSYNEHQLNLVFNYEPLKVQDFLDQMTRLEGEPWYSRANESLFAEVLAYVLLRDDDTARDELGKLVKDQQLSEFASCLKRHTASRSVLIAERVRFVP